MMWDSYPLGGNEWILDMYGTLGKTLSKHAKEKMGRPIHLSYGYPFMAKQLEALPIGWEHGALGPAGETWNGGCGGRGEVDLEKSADWHHEHECYMSFSITDPTLEYGPISAIEEEVKEHVLKHKHMPKFAPGIIPPYWTPPAHVDAAIAAARKYGRYE
jgi:hypothetical protein